MELICIKEGSAMLLATFEKFGIRISDLFSLTILIFWSLSIGIPDVSKVAFLAGATRGVCKGDKIYPLNEPAFFTVFTVSAFPALRLKISF